MEQAGTKMAREKEPQGSPYIKDKEGQIVAGFIGKKLGDNWEADLPKGITKEMVYIVPQSYGYEWRLGYKYINSKETRDEFLKEELQWSISQPEEGVYDPRRD